MHTLHAGIAVFRALFIAGAAEIMINTRAPRERGGGTAAVLGLPGPWGLVTSTRGSREHWRPVRVCSVVRLVSLFGSWANVLGGEKGEGKRRGRGLGGHLMNLFNHPRTAARCTLEE
uniref:Putative secreted protein n=1 Tax=Anopheles darlingi TaxID=43151 RepID=A0A2M4DQS6_ANODA